MPWCQLRGWALCGALCAVLTVSPPQGAAAAAVGARPETAPHGAPGWSVANPAAPSWADQAPSNFPQALADVSCASTTFCVAVGQTFTDTAGGSVGEMVGVIETYTGGTWSATQAPFPPGWPVGNGPSGSQLALTGVSCPQVGWCVASGEGITPSGVDADIAVTLEAGSWTAAVLPTPVGHQATGATWVSCPQLGDCVVLADDLDTASGNGEAPVAATLSAGTWTSVPLPLPANAAATPGGGGIAIGWRWGISCAGVDSCTAVGMDTTSAGATGAWIDTESGATWTTLPVPVPANAALVRGQPAELALDDVSCVTAQSCTAVGNYRTDVNAVQVEGVVETLGNGTWSATGAPTPPDADANQPGVQLSAISCPLNNTCTVTGTYFAMAPATVTDRPGLVLELSGGTWTAGVLARSASGAPFSSNPAFASLPGALSCASSLSCISVGATAYGTAATGYADAVDEATIWAYAAPPPSVTAVSPAGAPPIGGVTVTVVGSGFLGPGTTSPPAVSFGTATATHVSVVSDSELSALAPPGHGSVDVTVTTAAGTSAAAASDRFVYATGYSAITPARICDTRAGNPSQLSGAAAQCNGVATTPTKTLVVAVAGLAGVPADATMVALDVAVAAPYEPGWLTVYPASAPRPLASSLNFARGTTTANLVVTALGTGGDVDLAASAGLFGAGGIDVVVDVEGYVTVGAGDSYEGFAPERICDTRPNNPSNLTGPAAQCNAKHLSPTTPLTIEATGFPGVPTSGVAAVALSVTVADSAGPGWITVYPAASPRPVASALNVARGAAATNGVVVPVAASGAITIAGDLSAQVIVDVAGWIGTDSQGEQLAPLDAPSRVCDTRPAEAANPCTGERLAARTALPVVVAGRGAVPAGARSVLVNVTATETASSGYLTIYPAGTAEPTAAQLSWGAGQTSSTLVVCAVGAGGAIEVSPSVRLAGLVVDIEGWAG
ncbi:MAG: IPT/TIG domain-containing protein [Actinomycetota bacterium]|nr:IPT/TIG domain-containing protein [Actinomycetota bacterium]